MATGKDFDDENIRDCLEDLLIADQTETARPGRVSNWHTPQKSPHRKEWQAAQEILACRECAKSLRAQGVADIRAIAPNPAYDEFPDCFAELDGKRIGMEATQLIDPVTAEREWPFSTFSAGTHQQSCDQGREGRDSRESEAVVFPRSTAPCSFTDELALSEERIAAYLEQMSVPKASHIDHVFLLGAGPTTHQQCGTTRSQV